MKQSHRIFCFSLQWHRVSLIRDESDGPPKDAAHLLECAYLQPWDWTYVSINLFVEFCLLVSFETYGVVFYQLNLTFHLDVLLLLFYLIFSFNLHAQPT